VKRTGAGYKDRMAKFDSVELHKMVKAIRCMALVYRRKDGNGRCPLCKGAGHCTECAWMVIAGVNCADYACEWASENQITHLSPRILTISALRQTMHPLWVRHRLRMLKRWENVIMKEIAERD
jgi:hypothetical protein